MKMMVKTDNTQLNIMMNNNDDDYLRNKNVYLIIDKKPICLDTSKAPGLNYQSEIDKVIIKLTVFFYNSNHVSNWLPSKYTSMYQNQNRIK